MGSGIYGGGGGEMEIKPCSTDDRFQKLEMSMPWFVCGFKELGGVSSSLQHRVEFVSRMIEDERIPDEVTIQVSYSTEDDRTTRRHGGSQ